ncbi:MAG: hypothetical protein NT166_20180 [Candidatus Aminicenantes bacterium]|nr:hypothetical protein [Candidatus Aminicenantes bacterium]
MAQRKLTITLPRSPELINDLFVFLLQRGLISEKDMHSIGKDHTAAVKKKKSRWALAAERLDVEGFLDGQGDKVKGLIRDFREGFAL